MRGWTGGDDGGVKVELRWRKKCRVKYNIFKFEFIIFNSFINLLLKPYIIVIITKIAKIIKIII